jgi:hypothetical protein
LAPYTLELEVLHAAVPATLEDVHEAHEVRVHVGVRVRQRVANTRLRREVDHAIEAVLLEEALHAVAVGHVELHEREALLRRQAREARLLERDLVVVVDVVEPHDRVASIEEDVADVGADESGGAGDEQVGHGGPHPNPRPRS